MNVDDCDDDKERRFSKLYIGLTFLCYLWRVSMKNVAKTHAILKTGISMLNLALALYLIGFLSPYWVIGDKHAYKSASRSYDTEECEGQGDLKATSLCDNDTHFGVWEECVVAVDGQTTCSIFTEDIDSVILMFGCVDAFLLFALCCWTCLACLRKPKRHRYLLTVVVAVIGAIFGFVSTFIFIIVQGRKNYSWAFALFIMGCTLELCAAAVILWGVRRAAAQGAFPQAFRKTKRTTIPSIVVTGPTPSRKSGKRTVEVLYMSPKAEFRLHRYKKEEEDDADSFYRDVVSSLRSQKPNGNRKMSKLRKKRTRRTIRTESVGTRNTALKALARGVTRQQLAFIDLNDFELPCASQQDTEHVTDVSRPLISEKHHFHSGLSPHPRSAVTSVNSNVEMVGMQHGSSDSLSSQNLEKEYKSLLMSSSKDAADTSVPLTPPLCWSSTVHLVVDVHHSFSFSEDPKAFTENESLNERFVPILRKPDPKESAEPPFGHQWFAPGQVCDLHPEVLDKELAGNCVQGSLLEHPAYHESSREKDATGII